jgi:hypothetical protein
MERCLRETEGFSQKIAEKNRIRSVIKAYFKQRYCFTLIRPCDDESELQRMAGGRHDGVKKEFLQ